MTNERATKKQQELLHFVTDFIAEHDYGPSYREVMRALDYKSVSTVAVHIDALIAKGFLARTDNSARSLEVVMHSETSDSKVDDSIVVQAITARLKNGTLEPGDIMALERVKRLFEGQKD